MTEEDIRQIKKTMEEVLCKHMKGWRGLFTEGTVECKEKVPSGEYIVTFSEHWKRESKDIVSSLFRFLLAGGLVFAAYKLCNSIQPCMEHEKAVVECNSRLQKLENRMEAGFSALSVKNEEIGRAVRECGESVERLSEVGDMSRGPMEVDVFMQPCRRFWHPYGPGSGE